MIFILFGTPGVGKNYVGRILSEHYNCYFYDADQDLTPEMRLTIQKQQLYTDAMRDDFFKIVVHRAHQLKHHHSRIVITQALAKERNRIQIQQQLPGSQFFWIQARTALIHQRLMKRADWVSPEYAEKIKSAFEIPLLPHDQIENNHGSEDILKQFSPYFSKVAYG